MKEAVNGADEVVGVGTSVEAEVGDEGRLAESGCYDGGAVAVCHAAEGDENHDLVESETGKSKLESIGRYHKAQEAWRDCHGSGDGVVKDLAN